MVGPEIRRVLGDQYQMVWTCPECGKERVEPYRGTQPNEWEVTDAV
jgi:RNase P subunit RPR2